MYSTSLRRSVGTVALLTALCLALATFFIATPAQAAGITITGTVRDSSTGVAYNNNDGSLKLWLWRNGSVSTPVTTTSAGTFSAANLADGSYELSASSDGTPQNGRYYEGDHLEFTVAAGVASVSNPTLTLTRERVAIFEVHTATGAPLPNESSNVSLKLWYDGTSPVSGPVGWGSPQFGPNETSDGYYVTHRDNTKIGFAAPAGSNLPVTWFAGTGQVAFTPDEAMPVRLDNSAPWVQRHTVTLPASTAVVPGSVTINGVMGMGRTLTADTDAWQPTNASLSYQWLTGWGTPIPGATAKTLVIDDSLEATAGASFSVSVRVTARLAGAPAVSRETFRHTDSLLAPTTITRGTAQITGSAAPGSTLHLTSTGWAPSDTVLTNQWLVDGVAIPGATDSAFPVTTEHAGATITATVTGTLGTQTATVTSTPVVVPPVVISPIEVVRGTVAVRGVARTGSTLAATTSGWGPNGVVLKHQWLANGKAIAGATRPTFTVTNSQAGMRLAVVVTGTFGGRSATTTSAPSAVVFGKLSAAKPRITGKAKVGKRLTARSTGWTPSGVTLRYTWLRNGKVIKKAKKSTYRLVKADRGKRIQVRVTGTKRFFTTLTLTSTKTAKVKR